MHVLSAKLMFKVDRKMPGRHVNRACVYSTNLCVNHFHEVPGKMREKRNNFHEVNMMALKFGASIKAFVIIIQYSL